LLLGVSSHADFSEIRKLGDIFEDEADQLKRTGGDAKFTSRLASAESRGGYVSIGYGESNPSGRVSKALL